MDSCCTEFVLRVGGDGADNTLVSQGCEGEEKVGAGREGGTYASEH